MLVLLSGFLVVVVIHARLVEAISRLDFLWKRQVKTDLAFMETAQGMNKQLLEHILPDHVVNHFLSRDWHPDVSFLFFKFYLLILIIQHFGSGS